MLFIVFRLFFGVCEFFEFAHSYAHLLVITGYKWIIHSINGIIHSINGVISTYNW